jgi:tetratricopeptide (TPR) repeat protein
VSLLSRHLPHTILAFGLAAALIAVPADAGKPKKKKKKAKTTTEAPAQGDSAAQSPADPTRKVLDKVEGRLQAYATAQARQELGDLAKGSKDARVLATLGRILEQEQSYKKAETQFRNAARFAPGDPAPWAHLGHAYFHQKREAEGKGAYSEAAKRAQAAVKKNPQDSRAFYYLGVANLRLGKYPQATANLGKARKLSPGDAMTVYHLGVTRTLEGKWNEAIVLLSEAIKMETDLAYAYFYRGQAASRVGRKDMLIADLKRFLELAPKSPEAPLAARTVAAARR